VVNPQRVFCVGIQVVMYCALKKINIYLKKVIKKYYTNIKVLPLYHQESESTKKTIMTNSVVQTKKQKVKILGQTVTAGTKLHAKLVAQLNQFNDLAISESN
jgi:hypothetical protein